MKPAILAMLFLVLALPACLSTAPRPDEPVGAELAPDESLADVFERVQQSVATVRSVSLGPSPEGSGILGETSVGSGVLVSRDGKILTAAHVVQTADFVTVEFADGTAHRARVMGSVPAADVALIQLDQPAPADAVVAELGDADQVRVGSEVFVVGAPLGISHTLTVGHVSARRRVETALGGLFDVELLQTDAAINMGNSGGPMFDMQGRVVGVVSYIVSLSGGSEGLGFAVTSNAARELLLDRDIFWSGIEYVYLEGPYAQALNLPEDRSGLLVQRVASGSVCHRLGIRGGVIPATIGGEPLLLGGDVILEVQGIDATDPEMQGALLHVRESLTPESTVSILVLRAGKLRRLERKLADVLPD